MKKQIVFILFLVRFIFEPCKLEAIISNVNDSVDKKEFARKYRYRSTGIGMVTFRDFATSPLYYRGGGLNLATGRLNKKTHREHYFGIDFLGASTSALAPESNYFQTNTNSLFFSISGYYHYLYKLKAISTNRNKIMVGGAFVSSQNIRINQSFQNAAPGFESIVNFMAAAKIERDISRTSHKTINIYKMKLNLKPVKREFAFQFNVGVLNFNRRPGYAYVYSNEWDGSNTNGINWLLDEYQLSLNGWRLGSRCEFTQYTPNGNARRIAYVWDIAHVPGRFEVFQMAIHKLQFTFIFDQTRARK